MGSHHWTLCALIAFISLPTLSSSCRSDIEGTPGPNAPPETFTVVDTIIRQDQERFSSLVTLRWWGSDPDGTIRGFEIQDQETGDWVFTEATDSLIQILIPRGESFFDYRFRVRAVDNDEARDPSPAALLVPVKNTPPTMEVTIAGNSDTRPTHTMPIIKYNMRAEDLDGEANLKQLEIVFQDTTRTPYVIPPGVTSVTLVATNAQADSTDFRVLLGNAEEEAGELLPGVRLNQEVQLFARSLDLTDTSSAWDSTSSIFVRKQEGRLLLVNDYPTQATIRNQDNFYGQQIGSALQQTSLDTFDLLHVSPFLVGNETRRELPRDRQVLSRIFNLYDGIIWYANNDTALLSIRSSTNSFFEAGKKFFFVSPFGLTAGAREGSFDFTPIDSLLDLRRIDTVSQLLLTRDGGLIPADARFPELKTTGFINVRPFYSSIGRTLYEGTLVEQDSDPWAGVSTLMSIETGRNGSKFGICAVDLSRMNANQQISNFFGILLRDEFSF